MPENDQDSCRVSLRSCAGQDGKAFRGGYGAVVREERFFCAVLFHLLLSKSTSEILLRRILKESKVPDAEHRDLSSVRVFVEYAMARDLWNSLGMGCDANGVKQQFILDWLSNQTRLSKHTEVREFNQMLGANPVSDNYIQSPARWGITTIHDNFRDPVVVERASQLKWAFNVKPDIVIELDEDSVVCIEAKVESGQDVYSNGLGFSQTQCEVQSFLMRELLGFKNVYEVFLAPPPIKNNGKGSPTTHVTWTSIVEGAQSTNKTVSDAIDRILEIEKRLRK
jgi:hypothetical protein